MLSIATIGYEGATIATFQEALRDAKIDLLVDVRALASSRRPGFAKTRLAANAKEVGAEYLHLRALGTPADGRAAARAGHHDEMRRIFREQLATPEAQEALALVADLVRQGRRAACSASRPGRSTATAASSPRRWPGCSPRPSSTSRPPTRSCDAHHLKDTAEFGSIACCRCRPPSFAAPPGASRDRRPVTP